MMLYLIQILFNLTLPAFFQFNINDKFFLTSHDWINLMFTGPDALDNFASMMTIIIIPIGVAGYFIKKRHSETSERKRASKSIYNELQDALDGLNKETYAKDVITIQIENGSKISIMNRSLNHDFYDSLVYSGKINFLKPELHQHIQNIFLMIKDHNEYLDLIDEIIGAFVDKLIDSTNNKLTSNTDDFKKIHRYYALISRNEKELLKNIPEMQKKLEKRF